MATINVQFTLFSAFCSSLISTVSGGFLCTEGLQSEYCVAPPGVSALTVLSALENGTAHVVRSALCQGDYVQQKGPFPQQLEADGVGHIVAMAGPVIGPCGFSSLAATPQWLETDMAPG